MHYLLHVSLFFLLFFNSLYANNDRSLQLKQMQNESRHALVVGNSSYKSLSTLKNPVHDARAMRDALIERGFDVQYLENATYRNFEKQIKKFAMRLKNGGVGLFYYAGHGIEVDGKNYLVATDSDISEEDEVKYETVALNWIIDKMKHAHPRVNILILDACRNNPFSRSAGGGLAAPPNARGMFIAYATEAGKVAADGSGKHGVFTKYLIQNLNRPIDINAVFNQTQRDVLRATNQKQFPVMYDKFIGSFFFTLPAKTNISKRKSSYSFTSQKPKSYTLTINPTPYDAKVQITNIKPRYYKAMPLQPGSYTIKVSKQGYITKTGKIDLYEDLDIDVVLQKRVLHVKNSFVASAKKKSTAGIFIDKNTGLMWQDNRDARSVERAWSGAKLYCSNLSLAGYNDWYLPTIDELKGIVDKSRSPAIKNGFKNIYSSNYWSSTASANDIGRAWIMNFGYGYSDYNGKYGYNFVRCVRK